MVCEAKERSREIQERILAAIPPTHPTYAKLLSLLSIEMSTEVDTACVTLGLRSRLLINPDFVRLHCPTDGALAMLVMHELYHILLGHTRLFPRVTPEQNLVFDAVINAQLCREFRDLEHTLLFRRLYRPDVLPEALLRPPPGWGTRRVRWILDGAAGAAHRALYKNGSATYSELFSLVAAAVAPAVKKLGEGAAKNCAGNEPGDKDEQSSPAGLPGTDPSGRKPESGASGTRPSESGGEGGPNREGGTAGNTGDSRQERRDGHPESAPAAGEDWPLLLGNHGDPDDAGGDADARSDLIEAVERVIAEWPRETRASGRDLGGDLAEGSIALGDANAATRRILRKAILSVADLGTEPGHLGRADSVCRVPLPYRTRPDRAAEARAALGLPVLFYAADLHHTSRVSCERAHVYLDVSGSVSALVPVMYQALLPLKNWIADKVHLFSTEVKDISFDELRRGRVLSTYGTEIACVTEHMIRNSIRRALIVTDGFVGEVPEEHRKRLTKTRVAVALFAEGDRQFMAGFGRGRVFQLPPIG
ncbi:MAG: hypothetical protein D6718_13610 [Acidobacteria bacterium]|nr:MAG: hypothetical protein D6718_13610 [Acidobacteriota bacterium]